MCGGVGGVGRGVGCGGWGGGGTKSDRQQHRQAKESRPYLLIREKQCFT